MMAISKPWYDYYEVSGHALAALVERDVGREDRAVAVRGMMAK